MSVVLSLSYNTLICMHLIFVKFFVALMAVTYGIQTEEGKKRSKGAEAGNQTSASASQGFSTLCLNMIFFYSEILLMILTRFQKKKTTTFNRAMNISDGLFLVFELL